MTPPPDPASLREPREEEWQSITTAPTDGTRVRLKRVYKGDVIKEGVGYFGDVTIYHQGGPFVSVQGQDYAEPSEETFRGVWVDGDGRHLFPTPTHWAPSGIVSPASPPLDDFLQSQEFYDLMQAYRLAPRTNPRGTVTAFEAVKTAILAAAGARPSSANPLERKVAAILEERRNDLTKQACDECEQCGSMAMCSYHSLLSELAGHVVPSNTQAELEAAKRRIAELEAAIQEWLACARPSPVPQKDDK